VNPQAYLLLASEEVHLEASLFYEYHDLLFSLYGCFPSSHRWVYEWLWFPYVSALELLYIPITRLIKVK